MKNQEEKKMNNTEFLLQEKSFRIQSEKEMNFSKFNKSPKGINYTHDFAEQKQDKNEPQKHQQQKDQLANKINGIINNKENFQNDQNNGQKQIQGQIQNDNQNSVILTQIQEEQNFAGGKLVLGSPRSQQRKFLKLQEKLENEQNNKKFDKFLYKNSETDKENQEEKNEYSFEFEKNIQNNAEIQSDQYLQNSFNSIKKDKAFQNPDKIEDLYNIAKEFSDEQNIQDKKNDEEIEQMQKQQQQEQLYYDECSKIQSRLEQIGKKINIMNLDQDSDSIEQENKIQQEEEDTKLQNELKNIDKLIRTYNLEHGLDYYVLKEIEKDKVEQELKFYRSQIDSLEEKYWMLYSWPQKIKKKLLSSQIAIESAEKDLKQKIQQDISSLRMEENTIYKEFQNLKMFQNYTDAKENNVAGQNLKEKIKNLIEFCEQIIERQKLLGIEQINKESIYQIQQDAKPFIQLWEISFSFSNDQMDLLNGRLTKLNYQSILTKIENYHKENIKLQRQLSSFQDGKQAINILVKLKKEVEGLKENLWIVEMFTLEAMIKKPQYYKEIFQSCNYYAQEQLDEVAQKEELEKNPSFQNVTYLSLDQIGPLKDQNSDQQIIQENQNNIESISQNQQKIVKKLSANHQEITLIQLYQLGIHHNKQKIEEISRKAEKQYSVEQKLKECQEKSKEIKLETQIYKDTGTYIFKDSEQTFDSFSELLSVVGMLKQSPWAKPILQQTNDLENKINEVIEVIEEWVKFQRDWIYLEVIFCGQDIQEKLTEEAKLFGQVDLIWRILMTQLGDNPYLIYQDLQKIKQEIQSAQNSITVIMKAISSYLEDKRLVFPRFYFVSDQDLLDILTKFRDPEGFQKHVNKCFEYIENLELTDFNQTQNVDKYIDKNQLFSRILKKIQDNKNKKKISQNQNSEKNIKVFSLLDIIQQDLQKNKDQQQNQDKETNQDEHDKQENQSKNQSENQIKNQSENQIQDEEDQDENQLKLKQFNNQFRGKREHSLFIQQHKKSIRYSKTVKNAIWGFTGMISQYFELVKFDQAILLEKFESVDKWMVQINCVMKSSLKNLLITALNDNLQSQKSFQDWVFNWPNQVSYLIEVTKQTQKIEEQLRIGEVKQYEDELNQHLQNIVELIRKDLNIIERLTVQSILINDIHLKDIVTNLNSQDECPKITDFEWQINQRYYLDYDEKKIFKNQNENFSDEQQNNGQNKQNEDLYQQNSKISEKQTQLLKSISGIHMNIMTHSVQYGFEYMGNNTRLVLTPLTDRCYRTLFMAYQFHYGGAPQGPAGTGKTETVKDLSKACGINCVVFNASEGLNYQAMYTFFKGLAASGSWCCFDEFNRIDPEVLSVVAQHVQQILTALKEQKRVFLLDGVECKLLPSCSFNITMNPGYKGRSELPDNLKKLLRPVAMMIPDYAMISEIYLYSVGFQNSRKIAKKIVASMQLASQLLSTQDHYDFGMRSLKAILVAVGKLSRDKQQINEDELALQALLQVNIPKFTKIDIKLFNETNKQFTQKCEHLFQTLQVRHGIILIGAPSSGKTSVLNVTKQSISELAEELGDIEEGQVYRKIDLQKINPKSLSLKQLYGYFDEKTKLWCDGILVKIYRKYLLQNMEKGLLVEYGWTVFDGPVDAVWIENMNTVLDDNKKLCLNSGEIIKLTNYQVQIFECQELNHASPATISRCGMVYMQNDLIEWFLVLESFFTRKLIQDLFFDRQKLEIYYLGILSLIVDINLAFISQNCNLVTKINKVTIVWHFINYLHALFKNQFEEQVEQSIEQGNLEGIQYQSKQQLDQILRKEDLFHNLVAFAMVWSFGGILNDQDKIKYQQFIKDVFLYQNLPQLKFEYGPYDKLEQNLIKFKEFKEILEVSHCSCFDFKLNNGKWENWEGWYGQESKDFKYMKNMNIIGAMIPRNFPSLRFIRHLQVFYLDPFSQNSLKSIFKKSIQKSFNAPNIPKEVTLMQNIIIESTIQFYEELKNIPDLFPTPKKIHYTVNLRDIQKVCNGLALVNPQNTKCKLDVIKLWACETQRVFKDRLISLSDQEKLNNLIQKILENRNLENPLLEYQQKVKENKGEKIKNRLNQTNDILFCSFDINTNQYQENQNNFDNKLIYQEIKNYSKLDEFLQEQLENFNDKNKNSIMNLILFEDAINHLIKIARIIQFQQGHALLVGTGASGKKSLTTLACFILKITQIKIDEGQEWNEQFKNVMIQSGTILNNNIVFYISDSQITQNSMLEDINHILNNGEIPNLFSNEEKMKIMELMEQNEKIQRKLKEQQYLQNDEDFSQNNKEQDNKSIKNMRFFQKKSRKVVGIQSQFQENYTNFLNICKKNLKMVIAVNPKDKFFYHRLKTFPSLVNCTTINWFLDWPEFAYTSIAQNLILDHQIFYSQDKEKGGLIFEKNLMEKIIKISYFCYQDYIKRARQMSKEIRRKLFATPLNFIRFLKILNKFIENFDKENNILIERYEKGVEKIIQTEKDVQKMRVDLENLQIRLQDLKVDNQQIIEDIQVKSEEVDQKKKMCEQEEKETQKQKDEAEQLQEECESDLSKVLPILKQAADALKNIKKDDLTKMKSYANPSESIRLVMEGVCFALGVDKNVPLKPKAPGSLEKVQDFWDYSKKHLLNDKLQKTIKNHNKEQILNLEPKNIQKLKKLIENPDFDKEKIKQASQAAYNLSNWIRAVHSVYEVMKIIEPKREKLGEAKKTLEITTKLLQEKIESLNEVTVILDNLQAEYAKASQEKKSIEEKVLNVKQKLERAEKLITGLAGEKEEWKIKGKQCRQFSNNILGDAVMCANIVAYHGPFPIQFRDKNFKKLRKFLNSQDIDFRENFKIQDILSNAIEIWPICIDPQNQANQFIKEKEAQNQIKIINPHKPVQEILSVVENTLQLGLPLLIENFSGDIQPTALEPLILKKFQYDGSVFKVKLGDKLVEGKSDFKLYITCQKTNHIFSSNLTGNCQMIDFSVTQEGLQDHMLNIVVQIEEPYKEQQSSSKGEDLLSDEQLVQALETNKNESYNMKEKLEKLQIDQFMAQGKEKIQENNIINPNPSWLTNSMWNNILELFKQFPNIYNQEMIEQFQITNLKQFEEFFKNKMCVQNLFNSVSEEQSIQNSENQELYLQNSQNIQQKLPENWENLPIFHKLILLKCLKPEQVVEGMQYLIKQQIGEEFYLKNLYDLENILQNSKCSQPILFVLQSGTDIQEQIQQIAKKKDMEQKFIIISLGQGNIEKAEQIVYQGIKNGNWIMLQNCHLAPSFVPKLEKICAILNQKNYIMNKKNGKGFTFYYLFSMQFYLKEQNLVHLDESNYGGKITDKHDRKLLGVVLDQYINQNIYTDEFKISQYDKVQQLYKLPEIQKSDFWIDHQQLFQQYPQDDEAEVFGLDKNAQISAQIQNGQKLMSSILQLLPKNQNYQNDKIQQSVEQQIKEKCEFFLNQLPQDFNESEIEKKIGFSYKNNLNTVIIMEVKRYNKLLKLIKNSLNTLIGAIEGINIMHEENENIFNKIYENQVPQLWQKYSYNSAKKLGSWITDLIKRLNFINEWVTKGEQPKMFWVGGFFYTQSFFTAILQNYSRQKNIAIDNIDYAFEIMSKKQQEKYGCGQLHPENGCYIKGLYIEGGSWDKKNNVLNDPKPGQLFAEMPIIWCRPLNKKWIKIRRKIIKNTFQCPLYNTTMRKGQLSSLGISSNWLLDIDLPIQNGTHYKQWILRGVALISQLDD
ncbi:P-loop containing nucleoside triphosphate hydrolase [Pseudocohnilembus persalinus]|uniref:p-loop containing nucleoside triphosphate hydrolase n=1 Tax=Pseudocohnilembus persalinus TaxID=266149 RepID=A0A0V0R6N0_PSEPJ|nr:P-loop containing nucleoside triphosphate hydrolase [Pseudocohnilembus persalinus]|eukprot:KRX10161.1 P-loop containing nucleoside triphosphate hydrolase [Pseudocohnilembus persalinus]